MAVTENDLIRGPFTPADGVDTISLDFYVEDAGWLEVYKSGSESPLVLDVDYTFAGEGTSSGVVTLTTPANGTDAYSVYLSVPLERVSDFQFRGGFRSGPVNIELDRIWQALQNIKTIAQRTVFLSRTSPLLPPLTFREDEDTNNRAIVFDETSEALIPGPTVDEIEGATASAQAAANSANDAEAASASLSARFFDTRAEAEAGDTGDAGHIYIGDLAYVYDASGTALSKVDGRKWSPDGEATMQHFGAVGDGFADDISALSAAVSFSSSNGVIVYAPAGKYRVGSGTLTIPATARIIYEGDARIIADGGTIVDNGARVSMLGGGPDGFAASGATGISVSLPPVSGTPSYSKVGINRLDIRGDTLDASGGGGTKVDGLLVQHSFGGSGTKGGRHAVEAILTQNGVTEADNPDRNYVGVAGVVYTTTGDGGTGMSAGLRKGGYFGCNFLAASSGAKYIGNLTGGEINTRVEDAGGDEVSYHSGLQIVNGGTAQGTDIDAAVAIGTKGGAGIVPWRNAIRIGRMNVGDPMGTDSKVIVVDTGAATITSGFELPKCSDSILKSGDVQLTNNTLFMTAASSGIEIGSTTTATGARIDFHTSGNNIDYDSRIVASGGSASVGGGLLSLKASSLILSGSAEVIFTSPTIRPSTDVSANLGRADRRYINGFIKSLRPGNGNAVWTTGSASPEGAITAPVGSIFTNLNGGAGTTLYVKESGTGNTGWVAK